MNKFIVSWTLRHIGRHGHTSVMLTSRSPGAHLAPGCLSWISTAVWGAMSGNCLLPILQPTWQLTQGAQQKEAPTSPTTLENSEGGDSLGERIIGWTGDYCEADLPSMLYFSLASCLWEVVWHRRWNKRRKYNRPSQRLTETRLVPEQQCWDAGHDTAQQTAQDTRLLQTLWRGGTVWTWCCWWRCWWEGWGSETSALR